jgi:16S rRNA (adenine1518-N6/adenine1519-N6)-dimethyltransferase
MNKRRALGQHFLHDRNIVRKILDAACPERFDLIVEVGPGRGMLTEPLLERARRVVAIELDRTLYTQLSDRLGAIPTLALIHQDALEYPFTTLSVPFALVANLPYSTAIPILFRVLEARPYLQRAVVMLQKELAERIVARPGTKAYGSLSVAMQVLTTPLLCFKVSKNCFKPPPKVDSAVVRLEIPPTPRIPVRSETLFLKLSRAAFGYRRKSLRNSLVTGGFEASAVESVLGGMGLSSRVRAEELEPAEFVKLSDRFIETLG